MHLEMLKIYNWIVIALGLSPTQLNSTQLSGSGAGPLNVKCTVWYLFAVVEHGLINLCKQLNTTV